MRHLYGYEPAPLKVNEYVSPGDISPESKTPVLDVAV
jgi:hypothetical protein